ncbi:DUF6456 domain-containing protein [Allorhizobium sp. BGMRC 0089]|uniref:DUF6456 domain-containing protein n=1 Tax=Allorhizobium sonneratiae TaxID=2934936 RepID=UPI0020337374|nr:DUF6456 domain-containing protein [Allorhizobium sonneratiae]MCM2293469.1 DUF6456 domain-containing protein [Allorhizobium sonneratiae]
MNERKSMARLLRLANRKVVARQEADDSVGIFRREDDMLLARFPAAMLRKALADGLLRQQGERLETLPEAAAFLLRMEQAQAQEGFSAQHGERAEIRIDGPEGWQTATHNRDHSTLSALFRLKDRNGQSYFPQDALAAGEKLAADFEKGQLQPRMTASWQPRLAQKQKGRPVTPDLCDTALSARNRVNAAIDALGPELSGVVLDVCCFGKGLESVERERQWPARSAKLMLKTGLLALARHYEPPRSRSMPIRVWTEAAMR